MVQPLYKQRQLTRDSASNKPGFGLAPTLAVLFAFFAIHAHLALRIPPTLLDAAILARDPALFVDLPYLMAQAADKMTQTALPGRLFLPLIAFGTSLVAYEAARQIAKAQITPAVAVIWLNTTVAFGLGITVAPREALGALGLTVALVGLLGARRTNSPVWWVATLAGTGVALNAHPAAIWAFAGLPLTLLFDGGARRWLKQPGFALLGAGVGAAAWVQGPAFEGARLLQNPAEQLAGIAVAAGPGVLFFGLMGFFGGARLLPGTPRAVAVPASFALGLGAAVGLSLAAPSALLMVVPAVAILAAVTAESRNGRVTGKVSEMATPFAFLGLMFAIYLAVAPTNSYLPRISWLNGGLGWQSVSQELQKVAPTSGYVLTDDARTARSLDLVMPQPVYLVTQGAGVAVGACDASGLFVTPGHTANAVLGRFRQITPLAATQRLAGAWAVEAFSLYRVSGPGPLMGCPGT